jgi:Ca2+-binding RTX toxin-like protein
MITVKAIKPSTQQSQPGREDYADREKEKEKTRFVPLAFLLFLTGCAAYLKSFLPVKMEAHEERQNKHTDDAEPSDLQKDDVIGAVDQEGDDASPSGHRAKSSDNMVPIRLVLPKETGDFPVSGSPSIEFKGPPLLRIATGPVGDPPRAGNNHLPAHSSDGGGGSHGSGGGGGGGGGDQHPRPHENSGNPSTPGGGTPGDPARNRAPLVGGRVHLPDMFGCQAFLISILALLTGATDPDGDPLTVTGLSASSGTLTRSESGDWSFVHDKGMLGDVTLTYTISDGSEAVLQTAYFSVVEAPPIAGTAADDNLLGTLCADTIDGGAGDDNIDAREGNDTIVGGSGADHIIAGAGNDVVYAGAGDDVVFAGAGNDIVFGGSGNDRLSGEDGNDTIMGEDGDDFISGGSGADILLAGAGNDTVRGDAGNDTLDGGDGNDILAGGADNDVIVAGAGCDCLSGDEGNDVLSDGAGQDTVNGGTGDDHVVAAADAADDTYDGGDGQDKLDYSTARLSVTVDLERGTADGLDIGHDLIASFEDIITGSGDDHIIAGSSSVTMTGGDGYDIFEFQRPAGDHPPPVIVRKITDFTVGDRIVAATFEIGYLREDGADDQISDMFNDIYLSAEGDHRPVRFRFEKVDNHDVTFVDVHDRPNTDDFFTIDVDGHHQLQFTVAVA